MRRDGPAYRRLREPLLEADWDARFGTAAWLMSWDDIAKVSQRGFAIGSHFWTHVPIGRLSTDELISGAIESKFDIKQKIERPVCSIAPPYGYCAEEQAKQLSGVGFSHIYLGDDLKPHPGTFGRIEVR